MKRKFYPAFLSAKVLVVAVSGLLLASVARAQSYTITFPTAPPSTATPAENDVNGQGIETGVRFRVTQPGTITGIRFYKVSDMIGVHTAHLWTNSGTELTPTGGVTFTEPGGTFGWLEVPVSIHINSGVNFVASVYSSLGDYISTANTWSANANDWGTDPIRVIAFGNDPGDNGLYAYTNVNGTFPTGSTSANYWIDVRFVPDFSLPVTLTDLKAVTSSRDVTVSWKTSSETNNKGFEVQRSNNGTDWYTIAFLPGAGESTVIKNYGFIDRNLAPGLYYYQLKQVDFDGRSKNSNVVTATISGKGAVALYQNAPNPFSGSTVIRFDLPTAQKIRLSVLDMSGREVKTILSKNAEAGTHQVTLTTQGLGRQPYIVRLQSESGSMTKTILVQ